MASGSNACTRAPPAKSDSMTVIDGASLISSVRGLNASPQIANVRPDNGSPKCLFTLSNNSTFWLSFTCSTALRSAIAGLSPPMLIMARMSFGKHDPPNPTPGKMKCGPMRRSRLIARRTSLTSAFIASHRRATSLMKEIFVASMALAAYLLISALRLSMTRIGFPVRKNGS